MSVVSDEDEVLPFHAYGDGDCDINANGDGGPRSRTAPTPPVEPSRLSRMTVSTFLPYPQIEATSMCAGH